MYDDFIINGTEYRVVDKWKVAGTTYFIGCDEVDNGTWYAGQVVDTSKDYHGVYSYELSNYRPSRKDVEEMHINYINRYGAEIGADGNHG